MNQPKTVSIIRCSRSLCILHNDGIVYVHKGAPATAVITFQRYCRDVTRVHAAVVYRHIKTTTSNFNHRISVIPYCFHIKRYAYYNIYIYYVVHANSKCLDGYVIRRFNFSSVLFFFLDLLLAKIILRISYSKIYLG